MTLIPWWCLFLHVLGLHGHIYRHGKSWNGYNFHTYPHPAKKPVVPRDIMVDVINNVGLKLLAIHNEYNENNIAISPYGAVSVIIALGEGLEGDAIYEIQQATHIPNDISVIRVGLRDIHRHLKSYFIPKEGFLAGLTLNHENVTLRPEYEEILKFYGYDTSTFNNALYPPPESSRMPHTTVEEFTTTEAQTTIQTERNDAVEMTTEGATTSTINSETSTPELSTQRPTALPDTTTNVVTTEQTTIMTQQSTTTTLPETTEAKTTEITTVQTTTTTKETPTQPTTEKATTTNLPTTTESTTTSALTTLLMSTQESTSERAATESIITTRAIPTTTEMTSTAEVLTTSELPTSTSTTEPAAAGTTTDITTTQSSELTTNPPTTLLITTQSSTLEPTVTSTTTLLPTTLLITTQTSTLEPTVTSTTTLLPTTLTQTVTGSNDRDITTSTIADISTLSTESTSTPSADTDTTTSITTVNTTPTDSSTEKDSDDNEIDTTDSSTDTIGFGGITKRKVRSGNQANVIRLNMKEDDFDFKRSPRSVVDYIIARLYDDQFNFHNSQEPYIPEEPPTFLVYGKFREYNINFMKYNTILPFHYEPHLNALALSFPLDSTKYYLLLLLPVDETGIDKLICDLRLNGSLKYIIANLKYRHVVATIPSFMLKGYVTLTPSFQKLGIRKVFEPRQADFAPMTSQRGIYVTNVEQAITVTIRNYVDPDTIQGQRNLHRYDPVHFKADHPFLYFVIDSDIHVTLMAGKIVNPLNSRIS